MSAVFEVGSGNVFADIGLAEPEERLVKAELAAHIARTVAARKLTQQEAARKMGISQAKVSALLRGQLAGISESKLHACLNELGFDVVISVSPRAHASRGKTTVQTRKARAKATKRVARPAHAAAA